MDELIRHIQTRFRAYMLSALPGIEFRFPGEDTPTASTYVVCHVSGTDNARPISFGLEAPSRVIGMVQIDVYTPKDVGTGPGRRIWKPLLKLFHRHAAAVDEIGYVTFRDCAVEDRGEVRGRHKDEIRVSFQFDYIQDRAA